ncbi:hypothetical protein T2812B_02975 [Thermotoga sp. 2812B]|nr:hypothetical protein T2812B_02975 [Thermotoga sp. 2812B]EJX26078.1 hypothetical protein EMP_03610 [Thermotoga sp. EMP]
MVHFSNIFYSFNTSLEVWKRELYKWLQEADIGFNTSLEVWKPGALDIIFDASVGFNTSLEVWKLSKGRFGFGFSPWFQYFLRGMET